ncbi:MAG: primosomal replication protein N [Gallionellaceae bacterium]|jgi:primosomal replication protein N|nr:primosomal replication protein N [Gallionellaceae bacterium]
MESRNRFVVDGELVELDGLRYTPAGIAQVSFKIRHASTQQEAGMPRQVKCDIPALALGEVARQASGMRNGQRVRAEGFLAQRSLRIAQLVMHIDNIIVLNEGA